MGQTKTPFFSMGAHGTVGGSMTAQKRAGSTLIRTKPLPTYRRTLPQLYQRWLYEDYVYLWTQQSAATKQEYATAGSRYHLTAFQYWMKYNLTHLPDIAGMWYLDEASGAIARDSSRNANHGTIIGATPASLAIDGAREFDGVNNFINCGTSPTLRFTSSFALETFVLWKVDVTTTALISSEVWPTGGYTLYVSGADQLRWHIYGLIPVSGLILANPPLNTLHHVGYSYDHQNHFLHPYLDGNPLAPVAVVGTPLVSPGALMLGRYSGAALQFMEGILDHAIIYNRHRDDNEFKRHSERRYPPQ